MSVCVCMRVCVCVCVCACVCVHGWEILNRQMVNCAYVRTYTHSVKLNKIYY